MVPPQHLFAPPLTYILDEVELAVGNNTYPLGELLHTSLGTLPAAVPLVRTCRALKSVFSPSHRSSSLRIFWCLLLLMYLVTCLGIHCCQGLHGHASLHVRTMPSVCTSSFFALCRPCMSC